ncbi:MAG: hypothetical protein K2L21_02750 [Muribaculaceae bacterium]|nr:hypothetical protein [Muribaculaceae bacterium]
MKKILLTLLLLLGIGYVAQAETGAFQAKDAKTTSSAGKIYELTGNLPNNPVSINGVATFDIEKKNNSTSQVNGGLVRWYANDIIKLTPADGITIKSVKIEVGSNHGDITIGDNTITTSSDSPTAEFTGLSATETIEITNKAQVRFYYLEFEYEVIKPETRKVVELAWSTNNNHIHLGDVFEQPTLTATIGGVESAEALAAVAYSSSNEELISVDENGTMTFSNNENDVNGVALITAYIPADNPDFICYDEVTYMLHVMDPDNSLEEMVFADFDLTNAEALTEIEGVLTKISFDCSKATNKAAFYDSNNTLRIYPESYVTISVPERFAIESISFATATKTATFGIKEGGGSLNSDGSKWTSPADTDVKSVTFSITGSGQRAWTKISVNYKHLSRIAGFEHNLIAGNTSVTMHYSLYIVHYEEDQEYKVTLNVDGKEESSTVHAIRDYEQPQGAMMRVSPNTNDPVTHVATGVITIPDVNTTGAEKTHQFKATISHNGEELTEHTFSNDTNNEANVVLTTSGNTGTTGIEEVSVEGAEAAEYFNLQGVRVARPEAGSIYLVRRAGKVEKQLVK